MSHTISYTTIRSKRRTIAIQIRNNGEVVVRAPLSLSDKVIQKFVDEKNSWISKHQSKIMNRKSGIEKKEYNTQELSLLKLQLREYITQRTEELWKGKNLPPYTHIKITQSEHRWGSCSAKNGLCFSYRLAEYRECHPLFIDAIIIHELAHLREKNHQKPFWNLVYLWMPEYESVIRSVSHS